MKKTRKSVQIGLGASSILMIFVVLCMMILSVLSYSWAKQNYDIAKREAVYEESYMAANSKAEIIYELLQKYASEDTRLEDISVRSDVQIYLQDNDVAYELNNSIIQIRIQVNSQQSLAVVLKKSGNEIIKTSWKLISTGGESK